jgi:diacylglycerol kinase
MHRFKFPLSLRKFNSAIRGWHVVYRNELSFRIELFFAFLVFVVSLLVHCSTTEILVLQFFTLMVLILEILNSAIEYLCDMFSDTYRIKIEAIKDVSASAVLLVSLFSVVVGFYIFFPYFRDLLFS